MKLAIIWDTETTGLLLHPNAELSKQPRITEFGGSLLDCATGAVRDTLNVLINPGIELSPEITKLTGITNEMLRDEPPFVDALPKISAFFAQASSMFSHNLPFDKGVLIRELRRIDANAIETFPWPAHEFCTVGLYSEQYGRNPRLIELYADVMEKPLEQKHRAMSDVEALIEIIQKERLYLL